MSQVVPKSLNQAEFVRGVRKIFGLYVPPFNAMDDDLLLLAFTPRCNKETKNRLKTKYGVCNQQTLEFYGDKIINAIIAILVYSIVGLESTPCYLTQVVGHLVSNRFFTRVMMISGACSYVRGESYVAEGKNPCGDTLEALMGALFVYLSNTGRVDYMAILTGWMIDSMGVYQLIDDYLRKGGYSEAVSYCKRQRSRAR